MKDKLINFSNSIYSSKGWHIAQNVVVTALFVYCLKALTDYDNLEFQTWKNQASAKAIFAFMAIVFIMRQVKLLNWQSLLATILFIPCIIERMHFWKGSPDIIAILKPQMAAEWLAIMIIVDMLLYKNVNDLFKQGNTYILVMYALLTIGMLYRRNGRMDPFILVFPFFLFAMVKISAEKWEWFLKRFIDGFFLFFLYVIIRSIIEKIGSGLLNAENAHFYGYFVNVGAMGMFLSCTLVTCLSALLYSKYKNGRFSLPYIASIIWLIFVLVAQWLADTRTSFVGSIFCVLALWIWNRKDVSKRAVIRRLIVIGVTSVFLLGVIILGLYIASKGYLISFIERLEVTKLFRGPLETRPYSSPNYAMYNKIGPLYPIVRFFDRFQYASDRAGNGVFNSTFLNMLNLFSSYRIEIAAGYSKWFNYEGNGPLTFSLSDGYIVMNAHNTYIQFLVEYGWITFLEIIALLVMTTVAYIKNYLSEDRKVLDVLPILWLSTITGLWLGEASMMFYPATFFFFMFVARAIVRFDNS